MQQPLTGEGGNQASQVGMEIINQGLFQNQHIKNILTIIKVLLGLTLLVISIQGIKWQNLVAGIRSASLIWMVMALAFVLLGLFLKFWRWRMLIRNYQISASISRVFSAYFLGQSINILLPFRSGELVRVGYFAGNPKVLPEIISTVVLEKYLDLIALTICGILVSLKISLDNILNLRGWLLPLTIILTLLFLIVVLFGPFIWRKISSRNSLPNRLAVWLDRWVQASQWLRNPRQILPMILLTSLIWVVMWLTNLLLSRGVGITLGGTAAGLVLFAVYIGLLPALMPGNIGPFYFFASLALIPFGIMHEQALLFAIILHAIVTLPPLLGGLIGLSLHPTHVINP